MRILITGAGGMLGGDLVPVLKGHDVRALRHAECDITDEKNVREVVSQHKPELIINCAAQADVDGAERDSTHAFAVNGSGAGNLARAATTTGARLFHLSTDYVFDGTKRTPYTEEDATNPISKYGMSKFEGERQVLASGANYLIIRTSWLFGLHRTNFVDYTISTAQSQGKLSAVSEQVSCPTWTLHLAQWIRKLAEKDVAGVIHVAGSGECSRHELACYIAGKLSPPGTKIEVTPITWADLKKPAKRPVYSSMISVRFEKLGLEPMPQWQSAIDDYIRERMAISARG